AHEIWGHCRPWLLRFRVENVQAGRAGIEVDMASAVVHGWLAVAIVEEEFARNGLQRSAGERLRDVSYAVVDRDARAAEQVFHIGCDSDARIIDQLEGFGEDAFDQRDIEQLKFWSHNVFRTSHVGTDPLVRSAKRSERD